MFLLIHRYNFFLYAYVVLLVPNQFCRLLSRSFLFLKKNVHHSVCLILTFESTGRFYETNYERYAVGGRHNLLIFLSAFSNDNMADVRNYFVLYIFNVSVLLFPVAVHYLFVYKLSGIELCVSIHLYFICHHMPLLSLETIIFLVNVIHGHNVVFQTYLQSTVQIYCRSACA
jgi:hypothetical protein